MWFSAGIRLSICGVVQFEGGPFGADAGQFGEVVSWRWATGGPFQRVAEAPGVIDDDWFAVAHLFNKFQTNGSIEAAKVKAPIVETIFCVWKPSVGK